ncbi:hypothetical protein [Marininema halotolerans]|uniref:Sporulation lipoprotein YhcN/YlaJ (Spore_YhcN_YlaJ) n=1 Tax=Marininema halotolerans TaxID=1155944 RepID=A0A1I6P486_9BACL|nr:hypothetical protein [Marininema halotolerans]SFS34951.1 Sporulation lipoprotein YhcN/YlaJ (Spore_YhcN_YlaJ) [Marininema halotolerans]
MWGRILMILLTGLFVCTTGCAKTNMSGQEKSYDHKEKLGTESNRRFETNNYDYMHDDGRFGIRNASPNLDTSDWAQPTDMDDKARVERSILQMDGVNNVEVKILGGHLAIRVMPTKDIAQSDYEKLRRRVWERIQKEMPRYEIRVRVGRSRWDPRSYLPWWNG